MDGTIHSYSLEKRLGDRMDSIMAGGEDGWEVVGRVVTGWIRL